MIRNILLVVVLLVLLGTWKTITALSDSEGRNHYLNNTTAQEIVKILRERFSNVNPQPKIQFDERTNSLIVVADSETQKKIEKLINQLDIPSQEITIEAKMVRTPAGNLTVELNDTKGFKNMDELFKDISKVETIIEFPRLTTFSGIEAENQVTRDIYYIADAAVEENGDITCKIKKSKCGIFFKALPRISEEDTNIIIVEYQLELSNLAKRAAPPIPAIAGIKEFESLWLPIISTRSTRGGVRLKDGDTIIVDGIAGRRPAGEIDAGKIQNMQPMEGTGEKKKYGDIIEITTLTVRKGKTGAVTGPPRRVRAITQVNNKIPPQISEYYRDYNFVSSFSSESERGILTRYLHYKELPDRIKSERLEKIYGLMKNLNAQVMRIDPEMIFPKTVSNQHVVRPELMEIRNAQRHNNEVAIEIFVYKIGSESNLRLISQYNEYGGDESKIPSKEQRIQAAMSVFTSTPREEIHKWEFINGKWMKTEANIVLLKDRK